MLPAVYAYESEIRATEVGRWIVVVVAMVLGAVLGSFLNVVVYRMPRRMSLSHPGSQCPACGHPIRWYDNVPIASWFVLGGRCRDCHARISARYPFVEALTATASALVAWAAMTPLANALPNVSPTFVVDLGSYLGHLILMCMLIAAALMEWDGHVPPARLFITMLALGFVMNSFWPLVDRETNVWGFDVRGFMRGATGLVTALVLSGLAWPAWIGRAGRSDRMAAATAVAELALVGVYLGAWDVALIAAAAMVLHGAARMTGWLAGRARRGESPLRVRFGWAAWLSAATLVRIVTAWPRGEPADVLVAYGGAAATVAVVAVASRLIFRERFLAWSEPS